MPRCWWAGEPQSSVFGYHGRVSEVAAYPWDRLERVARGAAKAARRIRRSFPEPRLDQLETALGGLLASSVRIRVERVGPAGSMPRAQGIHLDARDGSISVTLEMEPQLVTTALRRVLERPLSIPTPDAPLEPSIAGAVSALVIEAARRAELPFELHAGTGAPSSTPGLRVEATVYLDERPYASVVYVCERGAPTHQRASSLHLRSLGTLPIELLLVAASSAGTRAEIESLRPGDVWLPGPGWIEPKPNDPKPEATPLLGGLLSSPGSEHGLGVGYLDGGRLVLREASVAIGMDEAPSDARAGQAMSRSTEILHDLVLDAPVVVRVEVGSVTLTARQWAELRPGDVIETGVMLEEPVVLRVAGREVARGELVNVEGELGVRIRDIISP